MPHNTFYHTDLGAQQVRNTVGNLVAMLDQCLVNGGPTFSVTGITRSGTTATATTTAHGLSPGGVYPVERRLTISGAGESDYNITALCSITSNTTFTYTVANSPTTPATGTILARTTSLGWTIAFTATNKRSYLQGSGSNGFYLDVDDSNAQYALVRGYETMTTVSTGSNLFPTVAQQALNIYSWHKSSAAVDCAWIVSGNSKYFRLMIDSNATVATNGLCHYEFGDVITEVSGDAHNTMLTGTSSTWLSSGISSLQFTKETVVTVTDKRYFPRLATGLGTAIAAGFHSDAAKNTQTTLGVGVMPYPAQNGGLYIAPLTVHHNSSPRGTIPGCYDICHARPLSHLDYFSGNGVYAGKRFQAINTAGAGGTTGQAAIEVTAW